MLCCPCLPIGKTKKVHPVPVQEAAIPRPQRVSRSFFKRLRRLFKKKEKKTKESVPPRTDTLVVEGPVKDEPEVPATTTTISHAPHHPTEKEGEEERKESPVWAEKVRGPRHETPQSLKEEDVTMEDLEGGEYISSSHAPVMEASSGATSSSLAPEKVMSSSVTSSSHAPKKVTSSSVTSSSHAPKKVISPGATCSSLAPKKVTSSRVTSSSHAPMKEISSGATCSSLAPEKATSSRLTSSSFAPVKVTSSSVTSSSHAPMKEISSGDRPAVQVTDQSGGRASRGRSRSRSSAPTAQKSRVALLHQLKCRGLPNLGQTCYVNATLQCLIHLQALRTQLLRQEAVWSARPEALLVSTFVELIRLRGSSDMDMKAAVVFEFKETIALRNQEFEGNSQNDAHEFLSECLQMLSAIGQKLAMGDVAYQCPVDTLLSFQLRYTRTCQSCGVESSREELNTMLSLDLAQQGSVRKSLQLYFAETSVEYRCDCCGGRGSSLRCHFHTLPQVLILHLKRFCPLTLSKQHQAVMLDPYLHLTALGERTEEAIRTPPARASSVGAETGTETTETSSQYKLISILSHIGSDATSGHYIADCRERPGQWVLYNDHNVFLKPEDVVLKDRERAAYILFYIKE
ncbi:ubiquitin carboxyl-terminal hydrolase 37-like [Sardina pilchardus]|uniref:ubiquitin carboxyl-terminal hydrolase 37-like n=1 Tax=Sardina pilchardus TaxID=27697 RepID=UPI002E166CA9